MIAFKDAKDVLSGKIKFDHNVTINKEHYLEVLLAVVEVVLAADNERQKTNVNFTILIRENKTLKAGLCLKLSNNFKTLESECKHRSYMETCI